MRLPTASLWRHPLGWTCLVLLTALGFAQPVAAASSTLPLSTNFCTCRLELRALPSSAAAHLPVIGAWYDQMYNKMQSWLGNQRHMIQFGCIGMVVALFIIWWRKT